MIFETFSKRKKKELGIVDDMYMYDEIPGKLRNQIIHIWEDAIGDCHIAWAYIHNIMLRELGWRVLGESKYQTETEACIEFISNHSITDEILDIIEVSFVAIETVVPKNYTLERQCFNINQEADGAIEELNYRFKENNIGYEYINEKIIRKDREITHAEIVKPAIKILYELEFEGPNDEFMEAHKNYRNGEYKNAINNAQKSFESMMKTICEKMGYEYNKDKDASKTLIKKLVDEEFIPKHLSNHFEGLKKCISGLQTTLEAGLPTLRNRKSGHGQGEEVVIVPEYLAIYAINLVATNIVLLADIYTSDYKENK
ncbi:STM4504/CBY_0614 family protein [uncultured Clostridium sp.]|uniref:STM4504/CBY_0614 family protein n=1 Tax=uncultured Clostridium sp. TaxID=59620 RepID=UPI00260A9390|nr:hypothetical protein [uncultured Clostridium sp.]